MKNLYLETDADFSNAIWPFKKVAKKLKKVDSFADIFRSSDKIDCIDEARAEGSSKGSSRKDCRKQLGGNIFVRGAKVTTLRIPRGAFLGLLSLNYRGLASRLERAKLNQPNIYKEAVSKFQKLGGSKDSFEKSLRNGRSKKPLACGKKCRAKINFSGVEYFSNVEPVATASAGIGATIVTASPILIPIIAIVGKAIATREEQRAENEDAENTKDLLEAQTEGLEAQRLLEEEKGESESKLIKNVMIGSGVLVGVLIIGGITMKLIKRKKGK